MKTVTQRVEFVLNGEDLDRIKHLQTELHLRQKADLVRLALLKLEESLKKEKEIERAIKGYAEFPESDVETKPFFKLSLETIKTENW